MKKKATDSDADSSWSSPEVVAIFSETPPNARLMQFAKQEFGGRSDPQLLDIGCGAGSNAIPLAAMGWNVLGVDLSQAMLEAAQKRARGHALADRLKFRLAPMEKLPAEDQSYDFIVARGIWNLAGSTVEFRQALSEAARVARPGAALFVFTFSRNMLAADAEPVAGEPFIFTQFSGDPQCFLTEAQLIEELAAAGFVLEPGERVNELDFRQPHAKRNHSEPVIYEGIFRRRS